MAVTFAVGERLLCCVRASVPGGWASLPGTLYVTDRRLVFDRGDKHAFAIPLADVESVSVVPMFLFHQGLEVLTEAGLRRQVYVLRRPEVLRLLLDALAGQNEWA